MVQEYKTQNVAIATMLFTLGVGWAKNEDGKEKPCTVHYDLEMLSKLAAKQLPELKGMDIVDGARLAHQRGYKGHVEYMFTRGPLFDRLINAWKKQEEWIGSQDEANGGRGTASLDFAEIEPESAARLFCQWSKNRSMIADLWRGAVPNVIVRGPTKTSKEPTVGPKGQVGERTVRTGSVKIMSVNSSATTRKRLGI